MSELKFLSLSLILYVREIQILAVQSDSVCKGLAFPLHGQDYTFYEAPLMVSSLWMILSPALSHLWLMTRPYATSWMKKVLRAKLTETMFLMNQFAHNLLLRVTLSMYFKTACYLAIMENLFTNF